MEVEEIKIVDLLGSKGYVGTKIFIYEAGRQKGKKEGREELEKELMEQVKKSEKVDMKDLKFDEIKK